MANHEDLKKIEEEFSGNFNKQDFRGAGCMYADDGILIVPNVPNLVGPKAIEDFLRGFYEQGAVRLVVDVQSTTIIDASNTLELSYFTFYTKDDKIVVHGRWMTYWVKDANGKYMCQLDTLSPLEKKEDTK